MFCIKKYYCSRFNFQNVINILKQEQWMSSPERLETGGNEFSMIVKKKEKLFYLKGKLDSSTLWFLFQWNIQEVSTSWTQEYWEVDFCFLSRFSCFTFQNVNMFPWTTKNQLLSLKKKTELSFPVYFGYTLLYMMCLVLHFNENTVKRLKDYRESHIRFMLNISS